MKAKEIRKEARENLQGKWQKAVIISIIYAAFTFLISLLIEKVSSIFSAIEFVIAPALTYGIAYTYYHLKNGENVGYVDFITVGFKNFGRSWKIAWEIFKKTWWCILIVIIPLVIMIVLLGGAIVAGASSGILNKSYYTSPYKSSTSSSYKSKYNYDYDYDYDYYSDYLDDYYSDYSSSYDDSKEVSQLLAGVSAGAIVGAVIAMIIYIALAIFVSIRFLLYALAYYIAVIKEGISPKEAVIESESLMKGNRGKYFGLMLSFIGWFFLVGFASGFLSGLLSGFGFIAGAEIISTIIAGIGSAILSPYIAFSTIAFYENLSRERGLNNQNYAYVGANNQNMNVNLQNNMNQNFSSNMPNNMNQNFSSNIPNNMRQGFSSDMPNNMNQGFSSDMKNNVNQSFNSDMQNNVNQNFSQDIQNNMNQNVYTNLENENAQHTEQVNQKVCNKCGKVNSADSTFCIECGNKLD